jgi:hypothetical protein
MEQACEIIYQTLQNCDPSVVIMVEDYQRTDFVQQVEDFVEKNPDVCMEMPQVSATVYPEGGSCRVIELTFSYQNSREDLRQICGGFVKVFHDGLACDSTNCCVLAPKYKNEEKKCEAVVVKAAELLEAYIAEHK